ncbi:MAG: hypothetical protein ACD_3C00225G0010 [uncultured bacterium (gcode 4)]|uniref:Uncharacterized protein n=1 Tax=uncultured bacterium (gcode 4) TaxID=1234023 RepID=K2FZF3_9BACT|nr:MAG: hypothetical protein ACD_3C00225G0010 [uncultured bacterium (gcode 4)]
MKPSEYIDGESSDERFARLSKIASFTHPEEVAGILARKNKTDETPAETQARHERIRRSYPGYKSH